jgi:hypothetical protein
MERGYQKGLTMSSNKLITSRNLETFFIILGVEVGSHARQLLRHWFYGVKRTRKRLNPKLLFESFIFLVEFEEFADSGVFPGIIEPLGFRLIHW